MKKQLPYYTGWLIVTIEILLTLASLLSVLIVNGADDITVDHIQLLALLSLTTVSIIFMKTPRPEYKKMVLWLSVLPFTFIGYEGIRMVFV